MEPLSEEEYVNTIVLKLPRKKSPLTAVLG